MTRPGMLSLQRLFVVVAITATTRLPWTPRASATVEAFQNVVPARIASPSHSTLIQESPTTILQAGTAKTSNKQQTLLPSQPARRRRVSLGAQIAPPDGSNDTEFWTPVRTFALVSWVSLLSFTILSPIPFDDPVGNAIIESLVADYANADVNPLFLTLFNLFPATALNLACLIYPQAAAGSSNEGPVPSVTPPPGPFLLASQFIGFFSLGPYLVLRPNPTAAVVTQSDLSWVGRNVTENKLFQGFLVVFTLALIATPGAWSAMQTDPEATWRGFVDIITTSKLGSVSTADLSLLTLTAVGLTVPDYRLRKPEATLSEAWTVALATLLVPCLGSALYMALRPALPEE